MKRLFRLLLRQLRVRRQLRLHRERRVCQICQIKLTRQILNTIKFGCIKISYNEISFNKHIFQSQNAIGYNETPIFILLFPNCSL